MDNIYKEIAAHVLAYQVIRRLIVAAAQKHHKNPTKISFLNAARWVIHFSHRMAAAPARLLPRLYRALLDAIASCDVDVRPGRLEPRALTREWKHYPRLRITENGRQHYVGPSAAMAGLMTRIDGSRGVWKAPAGTEADIRGISGVEYPFSDINSRASRASVSGGTEMTTWLPGIIRFTMWKTFVRRSE